LNLNYNWDVVRMDNGWIGLESERSWERSRIEGVEKRLHETTGS